MTNTDTADPKATANQVIELAQAGSEMVRVTVNTPEAAKAVPEIVRRVRDAGVDAPVIALGLKRVVPLARRYAETGRMPLFGNRSGADGRTVGVVGASRIGRRVIRRLVAAGHQVLVADPFLDKADAAELGAQLTELDDLCRRSDVLTIHARHCRRPAS